jgi:hypothetical protein
VAALARERGEEGVDKSVAAADAETSTDTSDTEARKNAGMVEPPPRHIYHDQKSGLSEISLRF